MRYFLVHINPILHHTTYNGRNYSEFEIYVVMALSVIGPQRPTELSKGLHIDKGTLTTVIRRLRDLALIDRRDIAGDERSYEVFLTAAGEDLVRHLARQRRDGLRALFDTMDGEEIAIAACGLEMLTAHLREREDEMMARAAKKPEKSTDWRKLSSPEDLAEYDAFGPWIYKVRAEADMPRRFRAYYREHADAHFLLKIPRDIERAAALPGWDLYKAVLAIHEDRMVLMSLEGELVSLTTVGWDEIVAINTLSNLLLGGWTLILRDGTRIEVDHSTVSADLLAQVTTFIRGKWLAGIPTVGRPDIPAVSIQEEHFFRYMLGQVRRSTPQPVLPIHFEPRDRWCRNENNRLRLTTGMMVIDAGGELAIVNRGPSSRPWYLTNYASNLVYVPFARLSSFSLLSPENDSKLRPHVLVLRADTAVIEQHCYVYPEAVVRALETRGVARV
jgi:DNA-binding MarR family transcriptional regulator